MIRSFIHKRKYILAILTVLMLFVSIFLGCQKTEYDNPYDSATLGSKWTPNNLTITQTSLKSAEIKWVQPDQRIDSFRVEAKRGNADWVVIGYSNKGTTSFIDNGFIPDYKNPQQYRVSAIAWKNNSGYASNSMTPVFAKPPAPIAARDLGIRIKITWPDNYNNEDSYRIEKKVDAGSWVLCADTIRGNSTSYYDKSPELNAQIKYRLSAKAAGVYSDTTSGNIISTTILPPNTFNVFSLSQSSCRVEWRQGDSWTTGYNIDRQLGAGAWQDGWLKLDNATTTFTESGLPTDQDVKYRVSTMVNNNYSVKTDLIYGLAQLDTIITTIPSYTSVKVSTSVINEAGSTVTEWGIVYGTNPNPTIADTKITSTTAGNIVFTPTLTGLINNKTYYIRPYAINRRGESYGKQKIFNPIPYTLPQMDTTQISGISYSSANFNSKIKFDGGATIIETGVVCSTTQNPTTANIKITMSPLPTPIGGIYYIYNYTSSLIAGQTYYVKSFATNSVGTGYGTEKTFKTTAYALPVVDSLKILSVDVTKASFSGLIKNAGGAPTGEKGFVCSKNINPTTDDTKYFETYLMTGTYLGLINNLEPNQTYHVRAYAKNSTGTVYTEDKTFTTSGYTAPKLDITQVSNITYTSMNLNSTITSDGGKTLTEGGFVYSTSSGPTINDNKIVSTLQIAGMGTGYFITGYIFSLMAGQTYYIRSFATNSLGTSYGPEKSVMTTNYNLPDIDSVKITGVDASKAFLSSNLKSTGGAQAGEKGFVYDKSINPTITNSKYTDNMGFYTGAFSGSAINLESFTLYHVRAYAKNAAGIVYSSDKTFTTLGYAPPKLDTTTVNSISYTNANVNSKIKSDGGKTIIEAGFVYSTSPTPTITDNKITSSIYTPDQNGYYYLSNSLSGLIGGQTYYVRSYARNSEGTSLGTIAKFTTNAYLMPVVDTLRVGDVGPISVNLYSSSVTNGGDPNAEVGFAYGDNAAPLISNNKIVAGYTGMPNGPFSVVLPGLQTEHKYYVRSYVKNATGISYSSDKVFTTLAFTVPKLDSTQVTMITYTNATLNSKILSDGGKAITEAGFVYSTSPNPTINNTKVVSYIYYYPNQTVFPLSFGGNNLVGGQTYYVRSFATNSLGTSYGIERTFKTIAYTLPSINNVTVTSIDVTRALFSSNLTSTGGAPTGEKGFVCSKTSNPTIDETLKYTDNMGYYQGTYSGSVTGLESGQLYHVRAYTKNSVGIVYSDDNVFTTLPYAAPIMDTTTVNSVSYTNANVNSKIKSDGGKTIIETGFVYSTSSVPTVADTKNTVSVNTPDVNGNYYLYNYISNLVGGQTYYIRSFARNSIGTSYGAIAKFTTTPYKDPEVDTLRVGDIGAINAYLYSNVVTNGGDPSSESGFVYGDNSGPTIANNKIVSMTGMQSGQFSGNLSNLTVDHQYYARSYVKNVKGISYSTEKIFKTTNYSAPILDVDSVMNITSTGAYLNGHVKSDGGKLITECGFVYSTTSGPTISNTKVTYPYYNGVGVGFYMSSSLFSLTPNQTYYVRSYATNSLGTSYGPEKVFKTNP